MAAYSRMRLNDLLVLLQEQIPTAELRALLANPDELYSRLAQLEGLYVGDREARLDSWFSRLRAGEYEITSNIDFGYNCIAWSADDMAHFWWPVSHYWPSDIRSELSEQAFAELYASLGYERCRDGTLERGFEKVALFAKDGAPAHAARQLPNGRWSSKLGRWEDIMHDLMALAGDGLNEYGDVVSFFRRPNMNFGRRRWFDGIIDAVRHIGRIFHRDKKMIAIDTISLSATAV